MNYKSSPGFDSFIFQIFISQGLNSKQIQT